VPAGVPVHVIVELDDDADRQQLTSPGDLHVTWLRADGSDTVLLEAVRALAFPDGPVHAFVHGEASAVRALRRHLLVDRGVPRAALSVSGYWKRTRTDEEWRADKPEWNRLVEEDAAAA
jgi:NADPH-dependent ferric siderophore reductase